MSISQCRGMYRRTVWVLGGLCSSDGRFRFQKSRHAWVFFRCSCSRYLWPVAACISFSPSRVSISRRIKRAPHQASRARTDRRNAVGSEESSRVPAGDQSAKRAASENDGGVASGGRRKTVRVLRSLSSLSLLGQATITERVGVSSKFWTYPLGGGARTDWTGKKVSEGSGVSRLEGESPAD